MYRSGACCIFVIALGLMGLLIFASGCGNSRPSDPPAIQHVVVIFQENRTPDNLFHGLPNADIASSGVNSLGQTIALAPTSMVTNFDLSHTDTAFNYMYDSGKMDGADKISVLCQPNASNCPPPNTQFAYVNPSEVTPYFQLAQQYAFGDRMFQSNQGPSFPPPISSLFPALRRLRQPVIY